MTSYIYDGSFEGLLSCIFACYSSKINPHAIIAEQHQQLGLLDETQQIVSDEALVARVLKGIDARSDGRASAIVYKMFLSELPLIEMTIFDFIKIIIEKNDPSILENFANASILKAAQIVKMIGREVHRMHAFVRFQKNQGGIFYAAIDPDFNVLPLIGDHFARRYADQPWLIFDSKRHYGIYYNLTEVQFVALDHPIFNIPSDTSSAEAIDEKEKTYQALWQNYFHSVNIQERKNIKLHLRHMPKRYWKYLVEKKARTARVDK